jgi:hypothetical protein
MIQWIEYNRSKGPEGALLYTDLERYPRSATGTILLSDGLDN